MDILSSPILYNLSQRVVGAMKARKVLINSYAGIKNGYRILDIGCGTGYITKYLPSNVTYVGFDVSPIYIKYAEKRYINQNYSFNCEYLTKETLSRYEKFDIVMMNGLIHHLNDIDSKNILNLAKYCLNESGTVVGIDGCFKENLDFITMWMLKNDRGVFVRNKKDYESLFNSVFDDVFSEMRNNISYIPYNFLIWKLTK